MSDKLDRRAQRSKAAIAATFLNLLFNKGYEAITISEITEVANIGRSTFYLHFSSKADLLSYGLERPFLELAALIQQDHVSESLYYWLEHFKENQILWRELRLTEVRDVMSTTLARLISALCVNEKGALPIEVWSSQVAATQLALLEPWVLGRAAIMLKPMAHALWASSRALYRVQFES